MFGSKVTLITLVRNRNWETAKFKICKQRQKFPTKYNTNNTGQQSRHPARGTTPLCFPKNSASPDVSALVRARCLLRQDCAVVWQRLQHSGACAHRSKYDAAPHACGRPSWACYRQKPLSAAGWATHLRCTQPQPTRYSLQPTTRSIARQRHSHSLIHFHSVRH